MGLYEVISAPAVFVTDGSARIYQDTGDLLELTDDEAASFDPPDAIREIATEPREDAANEPVSVPSGTPVTFLTDPPAAPSGADESGESAPTDGETTETAESTDETAAEQSAAPEKKPGDRRRQGKPESDGQD